MKAAAALLWLFGACYDPTAPLGLICSESGNCPNGQFCDVDDVCRAIPEEPDPNQPCQVAPLFTGGGAGSEQILAATVDATCHTILCGTYDGTFVLGDTLVNQGNTDGFVARLSPDGTPVWAYGFGGSNDDACNSLDVSPTGHVIIGGDFDGSSITLAGQQITGEGAHTGFVAWLTPEGGLRWGFGPEDDSSMVDEVRAVRIIDDTVYAGGDESVFRISSDATDITHQTVSAANVSIHDLVLTADAVYAALAVNGNFNFGSACMDVISDQAGVVVKLDRALDCIWHVRIRGTSGAEATALALQGADALYVGGRTHQDILAFSQVGPAAGTTENAFVARLNDLGSDVDRLWYRLFDSAQIDVSRALVALDGEQVLSLSQYDEAGIGQAALHNVAPDGALLGEHVTAGRAGDLELSRDGRFVTFSGGDGDDFFAVVQSPLAFVEAIENGSL